MGVESSLETKKMNLLIEESSKKSQDENAKDTDPTDPGNGEPPLSKEMTHQVRISTTEPFHELAKRKVVKKKRK